MFACPIFASFGELAFVKERYRSTRVLNGKFSEKNAGSGAESSCFWRSREEVAKTSAFYKNITSIILFNIDLELLEFK